MGEMTRSKAFLQAVVDAAQAVGRISWRPGESEQMPYKFFLKGGIELAGEVLGCDRYTCTVKTQEDMSLADRTSFLPWDSILYVAVSVQVQRAVGIWLEAVRKLQEGPRMSSSLSDGELAHRSMLSHIIDFDRATGEKTVVNLRFEGDRTLNVELLQADICGCLVSEEEHQFGHGALIPEETEDGAGSRLPTWLYFVPWEAPVFYNIDSDRAAQLGQAARRPRREAVV